MNAVKYGLAALLVLVATAITILALVAAGTHPAQDTGPVTPVTIGHSNMHCVGKCELII